MSKTAAPAKPAATMPAPAAKDGNRPHTKSERMIEMLRASAGASIEELAEALGWQHHSVRAALTGLRKKSLEVVRDKQGSVTIYRIGA